MQEIANAVTQLHTTSELIDFTVRANDGPVGTIVDFALSPTEWQIRYIVVEPAEEMAAGVLVIPIDWVDQVAWEQRDVSVSIRRAQLQNGPKLPSLTALTRDYEEQLYDHYQRHPYWIKESKVDEASWESFPASDPPARW